MDRCAGLAVGGDPRFSLRERRRVGPRGGRKAYGEGGRESDCGSDEVVLADHLHSSMLVADRQVRSDRNCLRMMRAGGYCAAAAQ